MLVEDHAIRGVARLDWIWEAVPFLGHIYVEPGARGRGHSRRLLHAVAERARATGQPRLFSSSGADEAAPQSWHRHVGFRDAGTVHRLNDSGVNEAFFSLDL